VKPTFFLFLFFVFPVLSLFFRAREMRAGETVVVCGAGADKAQFVPFKWPKHAVVWVSVGCGIINVLAPLPRDADAEARRQLARAYVEATSDTRDVVATDAAVAALETWLKLVERASQVTCTLLFANGGVRVTAIPTYHVAFSTRHVTVVCARFRRTVRRTGSSVYDVLSEEGICATPDLDSMFRVARHGRWMDLLPYERCAVCEKEIRSSYRDLVPFCDESGAEREWLPQLHVCASCPVRAITLHGFHFEVSGGQVRPADREGVRLFGAEESVWQARDKVLATLALALASRAVPQTPFAAALATALCDLKLLRVVAERMRLPEPLRGPRRAISLLVEM
jgi:hypothetical protein